MVRRLFALALLAAILGSMIGCRDDKTVIATSANPPPSKLGHP